MAVLENIHSFEVDDDDEYDEFDDPGLKWVASVIGGLNQGQEAGYHENVLFGSTPLKDRRERIANGSDNRLIMQCFGRIAALPCEGKDGRPSYGTGTVFRYNHDWDLCYVLTSAHNIVDKFEGKLYQRDKLQFQRIETLEHSNEGDKGSKLRLSIARNKRSNNNNDSSNAFKIAQKYEIIHARYHPKFVSEDQCPYDLAILIFRDKDEYYSKLFTKYKSKNSRIRLLSCNNINEDFIINYELYGYPFCEETDKREIINGELYGMSGKSYQVVTLNDNDYKKHAKNKRSKDNNSSHELKSDVDGMGTKSSSKSKSKSSSRINVNSPHDRSRRGSINDEIEMYVGLGEEGEMFYYNALDTEPGESGSSLFVELRKRVYGIVGVHSGGRENLVKNWAVALNDDKIEWINKTLENIISNDNNKISWKFDYAYDYKHVNPTSTTLTTAAAAAVTTQTPKTKAGKNVQGEEKLDDLDTQERDDIKDNGNNFNLIHGIGDNGKRIICNHNNLGCYCFFCVCKNGMQRNSGLYTLKLGINKIDDTFATNIVGITCAKYSKVIKRKQEKENLQEYYDHQWLNDTEYIGWSSSDRKDENKYLPNGLYCGFSDNSRLNNVFRRKKWLYKSRNNNYKQRLPGWKNGDIIVLSYNSDLNILSFSKENDNGLLNAFIKDLPEVKAFYWFIGHANGHMSITVVD